MNSKEAEKLQNEIYQKMAPAKKLKIAGDLFLLGKKLEFLKYENRKARRTSTSNSKNFK